MTTYVVLVKCRVNECSSF